MSNRSNTSNLSQSNSFVGNIKLSIVNTALLCIFVVAFVVLFMFLPVASVSQAGFDSTTGAITINVEQLSGLQALLGNNPAVGSAMRFNFVVLIVLILAVAVIPLNIVTNKIVRLVGACVAVVALTMLFFLPKMIFSTDGTLVFHPTYGLMLMIIFLTVATALSINNVLVVYNVKKDITLAQKISTVRTAYTAQNGNEQLPKATVPTVSPDSTVSQAKVEQNTKSTKTVKATPIKSAVRAQSKANADKVTQATKTTTTKTNSNNKK